MASLGSFLLLATFVVCAYAAAVSVAGARRGRRPLIESGIGAFYLTAALMSVAKIPYDDAEDGISLTLSMVPAALGSEDERITRGANALDAYFSIGGFHVNVNVLNRDTLRDAMEHPEKYPQLTVRVSGYAVNFVKLTKEQQLDVINRTFHGSM